jgi:hypothetical protein
MLYILMKVRHVVEHERESQIDIVELLNDSLYRAHRPFIPFTSFTSVTLSSSRAKESFRMTLRHSHKT